MSKKVIHFITELSIGGAQKVLYHLLDGLEGDEYQFDVCCWYGGDGVVADEIRALGIKVVDFGMKRKGDPRAIWRFYRYLREERPFILHSWLFHANIPSRLIGRLCRVPIIINSEHTMEMEGGLRLFLNRVTVAGADFVTGVSESVSQFLRAQVGLPADKVVTIVNGVDLSRFQGKVTKAEARAQLGLPADRLLVGGLGRQHPVKGFDLLVAAFALIEARYPSLDLVLVGDGVCHEELKEQVIGLGIEGRVHFRPFQNDVPAVLPLFDLLVLPSRHEALPMIVLEGMAAGQPWVATGVGSLPQLIEDGENGLLVPAGDIEKMGEGIGRLVEDEQLRHQIGAAGQRLVAEQYSLKQMCQQTIDLYELASSLL